MEHPRPRRDHGHARGRHGLRQPHRRRDRRGRRVRGHIGSIFETWPDIHFETRRLYVRDGVATQEWTAHRDPPNEMKRGDLVVEPTGKTISRDGVDVIPFEDGLVKR
ncbi:MAG: nuclear transport factor 2 family protein [Solirubrobacterales bacterium]|nr:nuclear transport factor 2 family protein [Solirubrobacterales bacterium]